MQTCRKKVCKEQSSSESSSSENEKTDVVGNELDVTYATSGTADREGPSDMGATAVSEIDTDINQDAQAQFERVQKILKEGHGDDKVLFLLMKVLRW